MSETPLVKILLSLRSMTREDEFSVNLVGSAINCFMLYVLISPYILLLLLLSILQLKPPNIMIAGIIVLCALSILSIM